MREKVELFLTIVLVVLVGILAYDRMYPTAPPVPGPAEGEVLEIEVDGPTTVAVFTTTCPWCAKSWPRWQAMSNVTLVSLDSPEATQAYLDEMGISLPVTYARLSTPVPVEFDVDSNRVILAKRLGYQGDPQ